MNIDKLKNFPNQLTDFDGQECVALTIADIAGNIDGQLYNSDFTYAMTLLLEGVAPTTAGSDPFIGMDSAVAYGLLPQSAATFTAKTMGELYASNAANYSSQQKSFALANAKKGFMNLQGFAGTNYDSIIDYLNKYQWGISMPMRWFSSFIDTPSTGILPIPSGPISNHNVAIYGMTDSGFLIIKPWLGAQFGDNGYGYMSREICNLVCQGIYGFDPRAIRWLSLLAILINKGLITPSIIPSLVGLG